MSNRIGLGFIAGMALVVAGVAYHTAQSQERSSTKKSDHAAVAAHGEASQPTLAVAVVHGLKDENIKGKVTFTQKDGGVEIVAEISGLKPGEHGFHVHEFGDCSMADGKCAGGHFNPTGAPHGGPDSDKRHAGDFGNLKADEDGKATYKRVDKMVSLHGPNSIIGRSVIIHAKADDFKTQPAGDAGDRIACGTIGIADPKMQMGH